MTAAMALHVALSMRLDAIEAYRLAHAYRDEVLAKAAADTAEAYPGELEMLRGLVRTLRTVVRADDADMGEVRRLLHHHASDDAAARTEGKSSHPADATPDPAPTDDKALRWPDDWDTVLDTAIHTWGGEWDTKRVQRLYIARYGRGLYRADARKFLYQRARHGALTLHDSPHRRFYTLKTRKDRA